MHAWRRARHAARRLPALSRERVLHAMDQELFDRLQQRSTGAFHRLWKQP